MKDFIIVAIILLILAVSICYIIKEKKRGVKCIGCPFSDACSNKQQVRKFKLNK
uniref:FeoB-associated Cys-rich membrane protein n=1 Tax=Agathobacter sp. TaxID=2021311 RepID=UPI004056FFEE